MLGGILGAIALGTGAFVAGTTLLGGGSSAARPEPARFVPVAATAGLDHVYDGDFEFFVGGGVAVFDCDGDGRQDVYLAGGANPAALYRNRSDVGGELRFEREPSAVTDLDDVSGAYPLDVDSDGIVDLAVLRLGENVLLRGTGECGFERANEALGVDGGDAWTAAFSATWEGNATLPTLAFGNYIDLAKRGQETDDLCADNALLRPDANGRGYAAIPLSPGWCTLSILFSDWQRSGERDLRMANDRHYYRDGEEQLWRIRAGEPPRQYTSDDGWQRMQIWGMGIASQDVTGDGRPEVFLTSQGDNKLQTLVDGAAGPTYRDIALERGATAHRPYAGGDELPSTAWHPEFEDVNNDGAMDLFITKGNVEAQPDYATRDPSDLLLGQVDGTFVESGQEAGIVSFARARGAALADFNLDGLLDLVVVNRREPAGLWRNIGRGSAEAPDAIGNWLAIDLEQPAPNVDAIGAWVEVRAGDRSTAREVSIGGGHAGGQLGWIHVGLGVADRAEVRVTWPDGEQSQPYAIDANQFVTIERGAAAARPWQPPAD